jgi:hypothetical protein
MEGLKKFIRETIEKHPTLEEEVMDLYQLCLDEIEQGGSTQHEIYSCMSSIDDLVDGITEK